MLLHVLICSTLVEMFTISIYIYIYNIAHILTLKHTQTDHTAVPVSAEVILVETEHLWQ